MVWNKLFHKSKSNNNTNSNTSNCIASCSGGGGSGDKVSDISSSEPLSLPCTPKLKKKTKLKSVFSSLTLRSSSSASKKSIIAQNSIFNDAAATILNDNNIDDVTKSRAEAIVEDIFNEATGSIKDDDDHRLVNRIPSHESSSSPTPPPIPPPPSQRAVGGGAYHHVNDPHIITATTPPDLSLHPCPICARTFIPVTLAKHVSICEKMAQKKRKIFDSSRQRREGTDLALLPPKPEYIKVTPPKSVPAPVQKKKSTEHIVHQQQQHHQTTQQTAPVHERRDSLPARLETTPTQQAPKLAKRSLGPVTDQCPHCERFFGIKAYDRHVEWCKEKTRISVGHNNSTSNVAKERLQARTKYRAPPLKTKRAANREKYSGFSGDDMSNHSLSEFQISPPIKAPNSVLLNNSGKQDSNNNKQSLQNSMTSSTTSEGALSDSYDPFISAKRQLEELFSPSNTSTPTANNNKSYTQPTSSSMSRSVNLNTVKSNFKRTSSLRLPKTNISSLKPINNLFSNKKPTIQRGISVDDGPISSSFLKSSEFDEMPVKAAFVTPIVPHRAIQMRDPNSVRGRKTSKNFDKTEHELSKTDSLAVFLKYEHELSMNPSLTEKEIKDKNNSFSKRLSNISQSSSNNSNDNLNSSNKMMTTSSSTAGIDPKLINLCDNLPINITKLSDNDNSSTSDSTIDLNFSTAKMNDSNSFENGGGSKNISDNSNNNNNNRNSTESRRLKRSLKLSKENFLFDNSSSDNTNNNDNDNNIISNNNDNNDSHNNKDDQKQQQTEPISNNDHQKTVVITNNNSNNNNNSNCNNNIKLTTDKLFDDFDLDEFISSFEDDENFPIFKDYKEFIRQTNTITKTNSNNNNNNISNLTFRPSKENLNLNNNNSNDVENELSKLIKQIQISNNSDSSTYLMNNDNNNNNIEQHHIDNAELINHNRNINDQQQHPQQQQRQHTMTSCSKRISNEILENIIHDNDDDDDDDGDDNDVDNDIDDDGVEEEIMSPQSGLKKLNDFTDAETELLRSVNELDRLCESSSSTMYHRNQGGSCGGGVEADSDEVSSVESFPLSGNPKSGSKLSADSAYGSLSRHSPEEPILRQTRSTLQRPRQYQGVHNNNNNDNNTNTTNNNNNNISNSNSTTSITLEKIATTKLHSIPLNNNRIISSQSPSPKYHTDRNLSSSESETSLPPIYTRKIELTPNPNHQIMRGDRGDSVSPDCKMSKFCHECGNKFLMATAKFCMECGVKRMALE